jgi:hydrogenase/urease accessory protein HupE
VFVKQLSNMILVCYDGRVERSLRAARVATFVYFVLAGTLMGMWLVQIPAVETWASALLPALLLVVAAVAAGILRTGSQRESEPEPELAQCP